MALTNPWLLYAILRLDILVRTIAVCALASGLFGIVYLVFLAFACSDRAMHSKRLTPAILWLRQVRRDCTLRWILVVFTISLVLRLLVPDTGEALTLVVGPALLHQQEDALDILTKLPKKYLMLLNGQVDHALEVQMHEELKKK